VLQAFRALVRAPGLTGAIVLTVGIGIGGCTAVFAVVDLLFLRPLPYPDAGELVRIYTDSPPNRWPFSVVDFQALQSRQSSFESVVAYTSGRRTLTTATGAERIPTVEATPGFFPVLGVAPISGRTPGAGDGRPDAPGTVLVTRGFASRYLGTSRADGSDALGRTVRLDGEAHAVIGVLPPSVGPLGGDARVFPTLRLQPPERKGPFFLRVVGRLPEGADRARAMGELRAINASLFPIWVDSYQDDRASWGMKDLAVMLRGDSGGLLTILMGAVVALLLVAVANATSLLLARASGRRREIAVRRVLGASRSRVAGHLLVESALLATGGVAVGLLTARAAVGLLPVVAAGYIPRVAEVHMSPAVIAFAGALALGCGVLFGLVPMLHGVGGGEPGPFLRSGGRTSTAGFREQRLQQWLVMGQLAAATPLLAGAGLLVSSFVNLQRADPGFEPRHLLTVRVSPSPTSWDGPEERGQFWDALLERISADPRVVAAAVANARPPLEVAIINNFDLEDRPTPPGESQPNVPWILADAAYFETLGIPLLAGRPFEPRDREYDPEVAVVDRAWAERFFPGEEAVGRRFRHGGCTDCPWTTVIGVVGVVPYQGLEGRAGGAVYQPDPRRFSAAPFLFVRTRGEPDGLAPWIREAVSGMDRSTPVTRVRTGSSLLEGSLTRPRHLTLLSAVFSGVALALAVVGLYGVTSYSVQRRRAEIAVRLALGGSPGTVLRSVVARGMALAGGGLAVGTVAALGVARSLDSLLFDVSPLDPGPLVVAAALVLVVAAVACLVPGRRAVRVDPVSALREE
jgi:putative ABC transport system permease protein